MRGLVERSVAAKVALAPAAFALLGVAVLAAASHRMLLGAANRTVEDQARTLAGLMEAARRHADEQVLARIDPRSPAAIKAHGSAGIRAAVAEHVKEAAQPGITVRVAALNPANKENAATEHEARVIATLAADPGLKRLEDEVTREGVRCWMVAVPVAVTQDRCLRCHSVPKAAPAARLKAGGTGGYGWKRGQVVAASIAYVPVDPARRQAAGIFWSILRVCGLFGAGAAVLLWWRLRTVVAGPLAALSESSRALRRGEWNTRFPAGSHDEVGTLGATLQETTMWLRERVAQEEKKRALFQQFIPASVAARSLGLEADKILTGARQSVTVMIINIRNFKLLMEHLPPEETVATLNEFFTEVNRVIVAHHGLVSKYLGDTVMAFFGMPVDDRNHALDAVRAAMAIPQALQNLYVRLDERHGWELGVGIGITTGEPIVGHFGSSEHMEYTVLGDVVVEAHRLEALTKGVPEEDTILITEATYRMVMSDVHVFDLGERPAPDGTPVHAYAVQGFRSEVRSALAA